MSGPSRPWRTLAATLGAAWLSGCASVHVDADGQRHVVGLVWLTLPAEPSDAGARTVRTRSLGLTMLSGPLGHAAVLGYSDHSLTAIRNDAVVRLGAASPAVTARERP